MTVHYTLRPAKEEDISRIIKYKKKSIFEGCGEITEKERKRISDYVEHKVPTQIDKYKVITSKEKMIGCLLVSRRESGAALIEELYVTKKYRSKGIDSDIIRNILNKEKTVCLWVYASDKRARKLYNRLGFKLRGIDGDRYYMEARRHYVTPIAYAIVFLLSFSILWQWEICSKWLQTARDLISVSYSIFLLITLVPIIQKRTNVHKLALGILIANFLVFVFFPFAFVKTALKYLQKRETYMNVVERIRIGEMNILGNWEVFLYDEEYDRLSITESAHVYKNGVSGQVIGFRTAEKVLGGSVELIYSSEGEDKIDEVVSSVLDVVRLDDEWYYVETKRRSSIDDYDQW